MIERPASVPCAASAAATASSMLGSSYISSITFVTPGVVAALYWTARRMISEST